MQTASFCKDLFLLYELEEYTMSSLHSFEKVLCTLPVWQWNTCACCSVKGTALQGPTLYM